MIRKSSPAWTPSASAFENVIEPFVATPVVPEQATVTLLAVAKLSASKSSAVSSLSIATSQRIDPVVPVQVERKFRMMFHCKYSRRIVALKTAL